ncbi:hypothetical protein FC48_GL000622 [Ligilactobacillus murinus DSM 20452 = NBRC 14221]|uniref:DNA-entry nuclease n=1 Tax=Ligilactobacillus murinus DSM 20452 = NBRC 14221 TaxID=1423772 RepID=A0A0R2B3M4_9LACO|nr:hypothetical protein [Ligilactobacillus murinus]KRM73887.1 hypothetical protein FC48_GL000622 [Ligilactobacillus murinus DSM 20452 = NBRC 14221]
MAVFSLILLGVSISYNNTSNVASDTDSSLVADSDPADESTDADKDDDDIFADEESGAESSDDGSAADLESERQASESLARAESESRAQAESESRAYEESVAAAQTATDQNSTVEPAASNGGGHPVNNGDMNTADANAQGVIVGNANSMIYHVPGQRGYRMNSSNAVYFNTEAEAQAAGYRKAYR